METPTHQSRDEHRPNGRASRLAAIAGAGLLAGLIALGATSLATAQPQASTLAVSSVAAAQVADTDADADAEEVEAEDVDGFDDLDDLDLDADFVADLSPDDHAVLDRFDACIDEALAGSGLDIAALEAADEADTLTEEQEDEIDLVFDAAFVSCDPILDELSPEATALIAEWESDDDHCDDEDEDEDHDDEDIDDEDDASEDSDS